LLAESYLLYVSTKITWKEIKKKTGGPNRGQSKIWGAWTTQPLLESPLIMAGKSPSQCSGFAVLPQFFNWSLTHECSLVAYPGFSKMLLNKNSSKLTISLLLVHFWKYFWHWFHWPKVYFAKPNLQMSLIFLSCQFWRIFFSENKWCDFVFKRGKHKLPS